MEKIIQTNKGFKKCIITSNCSAVDYDGNCYYQDLIENKDGTRSRTGNYNYTRDGFSIVVAMEKSKEYEERITAGIDN